MQAQANAAMQGADPASASTVPAGLDASDAAEGAASGGRSVMAASVDTGSSDSVRATEGASNASAASSSAWEPTDACPKPVAASIERKMRSELRAHEVVVHDESAQHAGHAGARTTVSPSGETHLRVRVVSDEFVGLNTVKRHRLVYGLLKDELAGPVHALSLETKAPSEA